MDLTVIRDRRGAMLLAYKVSATEPQPKRPEFTRYGYMDLRGITYRIKPGGVDGHYLYLRKY